MTTPDTLARLAADLEQLASEGPELIHTQSGAYISQKLSEAAKALAAQAQVGGRCDECGKDQSDGWALYCVGCLEKTGLLAKEALPNAQHVSSTAADLTGPNDTAAQATTGAATTGGGLTTGAITDHEIETLAHRMCWRYDHTGNYSGGPTYTFNSMTLQEFARKLMQGETE